MPFPTFMLLIIYIGAIPGIIYGIKLEKTGIPNKAIATFSSPDGTRRQTQIDTSWSWTVYVFRGWALAFRGQFMEFLILFMVSILILQGSALSWFFLGISPQGIDYDGIDSGLYSIQYVSDFFAKDGWEIALYVIGFSVYLWFANYYIAFANRNRIRQLNARGYDFSQSENVAELYKFIGVQPRTKKEDLGPNTEAGKTHDYVVPESNVKEQEEKHKEDYSMLTVHDLKLLLKSEEIPFSSTSNKEDLLKLVNEKIRDKK